MPNGKEEGMFPARQITEILGGRKRLGRSVSSLDDFDALVREGFPWAAASHAKKVLSISDVDFASMLEMSPRTLARKKKEQSRLNLVFSDRLFRLIRIVSLASDVLEGLNHALAWLNEPQVGLGGRVPMDLIRTEAGAREVEQLLGRLEYGVVS
jgi:putative toxin-antitoxin system antitoxin component (TIGR02293 family)